MAWKMLPNSLGSFMEKRKVLVAVALYIILGVVAYFNFGFHHLVIEKFGGESAPNGTAWKKLEENIKHTRLEILPGFPDSISAQEITPLDNINDSMVKE
jgi:hypothetical protein